MALSLIAMIPILSHCHTPYLVDHDDSLDLGPIDLRNLDPATARKMLDDIKSGADIKVITVINVSRHARSGAYPSISDGMAFEGRGGAARQDMHIPSDIISAQAWEMPGQDEQRVR